MQQVCHLVITHLLIQSTSITFKLKILLKSGSWSKGACVNLSFNIVKASSCAVPQTKGTSLFVSSLRGAAMVLNSLTKRLQKPARPRKLLTCVTVLGCDQFSIASILALSTSIPCGVTT